MEIKGRRISKLFVILLCCHVSLFAHEVRPAYLEIKEVMDHTYHLTWKVPVLNRRIPNINPVIGGETISELSRKETTQAVIVEYELITAQPIGGYKLSIQNLEKTLIDALVRIELHTGEVHTLLLQPSRPSIVIPTSTSVWQAARTFIILGVEHILMGWDHLLFVLGLMLLIRGGRLLLTTITSFTIAHSITLVISSLGHFTLPSAPVEAVIALSVVFLGREYLMTLRGVSGLTAEKPWLVAFVFGLLHGFGFAGALTSIGLPQHAVAISLLAFNVGVELGQIIFVLVLLAIYAVGMRFRFWKRLNAWPGYAIGGLASFWFITRILDIVS